MAQYSEALGFNFFTLYCEKEINEAKLNNKANNMYTIEYDKTALQKAHDSIEELKRQLAEEKEKSAKYWAVIENLTSK